jgi:hypothetical protein
LEVFGQGIEMEMMLLATGRLPELPAARQLPAAHQLQRLFDSATFTHYYLELLVGIRSR